jgi:hypothetical protein
VLTSVLQVVGFFFWRLLSGNGVWEQVENNHIGDWCEDGTAIEIHTVTHLMLLSCRNGIDHIIARVPSRLKKV